MIALRCIVCLLLYFLVFLPSPSWAAIALASTIEAVNHASVSSVSVNITVSAGSNRLMAVCALQRAGGGANPGAVTGVTFNTSETLTAGPSAFRTNVESGSDGFRSDIYYLANPTATTADVVVSFADSNNADGAEVIILLFTGVDQAAPLDASNSGKGTGTTLSTVVTTVAANAWLMDCAFGRSDTAMTVGAGQTSRSNRTLGAGTDQWAVSTVDGKASPGNETMDWTQASNDWVITAISLKPAAAATAPLSQGGLRRGF